MLSGNTQGASREELLKNARTQAANYYGVDCIDVSLSHEESDADFLADQRLGGSEVALGQVIYRAEFTADIKHHWSNPSYGFPKCHKCNLEKME